MIKCLTLEEILRLHFQVIADFCGLHGVRAENRLKSVVLAPKQEAFVQKQYEIIEEKAAVYLINIIGDHPFIDGNKRTAVTVCTIFLSRNNRKITPSPKELEGFAVWVAVERLDVPVIAKWLETHSQNYNVI